MVEIYCIAANFCSRYLYRRKFNKHPCYRAAPAECMPWGQGEKFKQALGAVIQSITVTSIQKGCAMRKVFAPGHANIYMSKFEKKCINSLIKDKSILFL